MSGEELFQRPFVALLDEEGRAAIDTVGHVSRFPRGAALMYPGQVGDQVHVLLRGYVKIWAPGSEGRETLLGFRGPGDLLGELAVVDTRPRGSGVLAVADVESRVIAAADFRALLRAGGGVAEAVVVMLAGRLRDADTKRAEHLGGDGVARVASRLVELAERFGVEDGDGVRVDLPVTQTDLSGWTGSSVETVGRALATMRRLGWVATGRRELVVLDLPALRERARG